MNATIVKITRLLLLTASCMTVLNACKSRETNPALNDKLSVTVMLAPQATIVREIAGDSVHINTLIGSGINPESYEPTVAAMRQVAQSDILMLSGALGFETQLVERLHDNNPHLAIHDTSAGIEPIYGTHSHPHSHTKACTNSHNGNPEHDSINHATETDEHLVADPHTWTSVKNARIIAANICQILCEADSSNASYYTSRYLTLDNRLDSLDQAFQVRLSPLKGHGFLIWHPSLSYLARDYDLKQITIGIEGKEITPRAIKNIIDLARNSGARTLFVQADFDSSRAETISHQTGTQVVAINPLDPDWENQIIHIIDGLTDKL